MKTCIERLLIAVSLTTLLVGSDGCMTYSAVQTAKGQSPKEGIDIDRQAEDGKPHPGFYCMVPVTVIADASTLPFQILWLVFISIGNPEGM